MLKEAGLNPALLYSKGGPGGYIVPTEAITYNKPDEVVTDAEKERDGGEV